MTGTVLNDLIKEILSGKPDEKERKLVVHTGVFGQKIFDRAIRRELNITIVMAMEADYKITKQQSDNLKRMLTSEDDEDFELGIAVVNNMK